MYHTQTIYNMSTESKVIIGFTAAALAGIGIGMLLAPYSGTESREKIRQGTNNTANKLLDMVNTNGQALKEKAEDAIGQAKSAYQNAKGQVMDELENSKKELKRAV